MSVRFAIAPTCLVISVTCLSSTVASAQDSEPAAPAQQLPTPSLPDTQPGNSSPATNAAIDAKTHYGTINKLAWKGWITPVPTFDDTILRDVGGWRSTLADAGFGFGVWSLHNISYDMAGAGHRYPGQQQYNGQKFNAITSSETAFLTYDLGRIGLTGGQIDIGAIWTANGYQARNGPRALALRHFYWYQPILKGKAELEIGLNTNQLDFIGIYVGGSLAGGTLGPQASLPVEAGMSYSSFSAPTISAKINWTKQIYTRTAVQRSLSPEGALAERRANPTGFGWTVPGARPLIIQEIGYRTAAKAGDLSRWVRVGYMYNFSSYRSFSTGDTKDNHVFYALADQQITQPDGDHPALGLYVGASFNDGRSDVDLIDRYYEGRIYMKGPFAGRPSDMASIVYGLSHYSQSARENLASDLTEPHKTTSAITASYSYKLMNGLYAQPGLGVTLNPVYNKRVGTAVNGLLGISAFF